MIENELSQLILCKFCDLNLLISRAATVSRQNTLVINYFNFTVFLEQRTQKQIMSFVNIQSFYVRYGTESLWLINDHLQNWG